MKPTILWLSAVAAALSVTAVPLALFASNHSGKGSGWTVTVAVLVGAATILFTVIVYRAFFTMAYDLVRILRRARKTRKDTPIAGKSVRRARLAPMAHLRTDEIYGRATLLGHSGMAKNDLKIRVESTLLLRELSAIEEEAKSKLAAGDYISVIRLRSRLQEMGIWSEDDVYDFDIAMRARNRVAHGDRLDRTSLTEAVETMQRLYKKLKASQPPPPA